MRRAGLLLHSWRDERGVALPLALMALVVLGAMSAVLLTVGTSEVQIAANHLGATQASFMAEAGLEDAFNSFRNDPTQIASAPVAPGWANPALSGPGGTLTAYGNYTVRYQAAGLNTVMVEATGTATSGSQKVLRATLSTSFSNDDGILVGGSVTISGNTEIEGNCGSVHANQNLTLSGNTEVEGDATAHGIYSESGNAEVEGISGGDFPTETIPVISPADFLTAAKTSFPSDVYQMKATGEVWDGGDGLITTLANKGVFQGWKYYSGTPARWERTGTAVNGIYYFEGNAKVSGNSGSDSSPWVATLIAVENITIEGNTEMSPKLTDTLLVAGYDIKISGNFEMHAAGLVAAHEQISISGNAELQGYVIAENASAISAFVTANSISGNAEITYDCGLNPPLQGPLTTLAWGH